MTEFTDFQRKITAFAPEIDWKLNEPMAKHTSFRIGGPAEVMAFPKNEGELRKLLRFAAAEGIHPAVLGAGTNVLAPDGGLPGLVICLKDCLSGMERTGETTLRFWAGVPMARAANFAASQGLSGMEFAHGIPGTVGGGVYMNAGAYGGEMGAIVRQVCTMDREGNCRLRSAEEMGFSYRFSQMQLEVDIILWAEVALSPAPEDEIREKMRELMERRKASQPLELPSAGSAFKRPASGYAAAMIDGAGLRGFRIGGAGVSEKHAGFVVNLGGATASDVRALLTAVADKVEEKENIRLEPEIRLW